MRVRRWNTPDSIPTLPGAGFRAMVADPAPKRVIARSTWRPGCPVGKDDLAWIRMTYWGFDNARHSGEMLVNGSAADDLVDVFRQLYRARFPIESMGIARLEDLDAPPTGDGNVTGSFACRPIRGGTGYSQHAYGLAVDLNPFQNPYHRGDVVLPELASAYLDRGWLRPGMITPRRPSRARVRVDRLGVGRRLVEPEGLPALQRERPLSNPRLMSAVKHYEATGPGPR